MNEINNTCPHCGATKNSNLDVRCHYCGYQFIDEQTQKRNLEKTSKIISVVVLVCCAPFLLIGLLFFSVGTFCTINENKKIEGFVKTDGYFLEYDYDNCSHDSDGESLCGATYTYKVDGKEYYASPAEQSNSFPEKRDVYYNPNNPEEAVILANWTTLIIVGGFLLFGCIVVFFGQFIFFKIQIKKHNKR